MLANMLPWAQFRRTYGAAIVSRELVQRRIGRMAALIVGCDALVDWCSWLLDQGYRGELECIIAKIFGSEAQKEAAVELFMKTHGGRAFLKGHLFGDNIHEYLAPCIYEGEGEMLGMAFFKSLIKEFGKQFFEPIGRAIQASGIKKPNPMNPAHAWALRSALVPLRQVAGRPDADAPEPAQPERSVVSAGPGRARRVCRRRPRARPARDRRRHDQAPASPGRPPVPDGRAVAAAARPGGHAGDQSLGQPAVERDRASPRPISSART